MNLFYARDWHPGWRGAADYEDKQNCQNDSFESQRGMTIINESGLYSLILSSKLPKARQFKRWVTSEVLPVIRKHGVFAVDTMLNDPDAMIAALQAYKEERQWRLLCLCKSDDRHPITTVDLGGHDIPWIG